MNKFYKSSINYYLDIFEISFFALKSNFYSIPEINLDIKSKNLAQLENDRNEALKEVNIGKNYLPRPNFRKVNSKINYKNNIISADIRLKGNRKIHFQEKKYSSYKVDLKKEGKILDVSKFSLIKPRARNYIHEWLFHELIGESDLIKLKYDFINLKINDERQGLYVFEEGFGKTLLERNNRKNGPIFSIHDEFTTKMDETKFEVYNKKYWLNNENLSLSENASKKLRGFFNKKISLSNAMDMNKWAWFFAVTDINNYYHGLVFANLRFFYNTATEKFEPIPYDGHRVSPNYSKNISDWNSIIWHKGPSSFEIATSCKRLNQKNPEDAKDINSDKIRCKPGIYSFFYNKKGELNIEFFNKYRIAVLKVSSRDFLDNFFQKREDQIDKINSKIYGDYFFVDHVNKFGPGLYYFSKEDLYEKSKYLLLKMQKQPKQIFIQQDKQKIIIYNKSIMNNNLTINKIYCKKVSDHEQKEIIINLDKDFVNKNNEINLSKYTNDIISCNKVLIIDRNKGGKFFKNIDTLNNPS